MISYEYDERQKLNRLKAYRIGFWVLSGYIVLIPVLYYLLKKYTSLFAICYAGFFISFTVVIIYNIFKGSYLRICENKKLAILSLIFLDLTFIIYVIINILNGSIFKHGKFSSNFTLTLLYSVWPIISICFFIKQFIDYRKSLAEIEE